VLDPTIAEALLIFSGASGRIRLQVMVEALFISNLDSQPQPCPG
jgi:hypothetical protein